MRMWVLCMDVRMLVLCTDVRMWVLCTDVRSSQPVSVEKRRRFGIGLGTLDS